MPKKKQVMPPRHSGDGPVDVRRNGETIVVTVTSDGITKDVDMREHNAWRVFGLLGFMLGIKLPDDLAKAIKL